MKSLLLGLIAALLLNSCKNKEQNQGSNKNMSTTEYASFGKVIISDDAIAAKSMATHFNKMQVGDSINSKMIATVTNVCQAKGCWMTLKLDDQSEVMVKFKDYGFFVPKDIKGETVIVNGLAYLEEQSVDDLRHYAKDAGKTVEEIEAITEPKRIFAFEADGVLLKQ
ncbi:DUF4920 domain-containing protein [Aestuariivivens sp. NBU2969]|uniref:DUF4920 domain-containing protein n=1 Tax=Aestuariivivens sp. NBU2969 TaxID=2873267 RepID=UPI001CC16F2C|nr:DUF4920 domain-containing protein [Aestuariivivens sp. NBU2969]